MLKHTRLPRALHVLGTRGPSEADVLAELAGRPLEVVYRQLVHAHDKGRAQIQTGAYPAEPKAQVLAWVPSSRLTWEAQQEARRGQ